MPAVANRKSKRKPSRKSRRTHEEPVRIEYFILDDEPAPSSDASVPAEPGVTEPTNLIEAVGPDRPQNGIVPQPAIHAEPGLMTKLFGGGGKSQDNRTGLVEYGSKPGVLRPFARRAYQRDAAVNSMRRGFDHLSDLMADIRDGLVDSVERQGDLLEQLKFLPVVAEQNARSAERFEEQFKQNNQQLARSNDLAGENLKLQGEALRQQADSVKALRDQIKGQTDQSNKLNDLLGSMGKDSRGQQRDMDEFQGRLDRMRESDQAIADNLGSVAGAIRRVSDQSSQQGEIVAKLQAAIDERTERLQQDLNRRTRTQGWLLMVCLLLAFLSIGAVAAVGVLYLRQTGVM